MKLLHISTGFPVSFPGGITNYVRTLAESQVAAGHQVTVLAAPEPQQRRFAFNLIEYRSPTIRPFTLSWDRFDPGVRGLLRKLQRLAPDLIHVHMTMGVNARLLDWIRHSGKPYVVSIHDYYLMCRRVFMIDADGNICRKVEEDKCARCVSWMEQSDVLRKMSRISGISLPRIPSSVSYQRMHYMRGFLTGASVLLPVSRRVEEIVRQFCEGGRTLVLNIGNASALSQSPSRPPRSGRISAGYIGTLSRIKGADVLAALMRRVERDDIEFHFHGRCESSELLGQLQTMGLVSHGAYMPDQLPSIMASLDVGLVLPIWEDNGPQVAMEFINYRIPVLGTNMGGVPDFVGDRNGFIFDPYTDTGMDSAVKWLHGLSHELIRRIATNMTRLTTPEEHRQALETVYAEVMQRRHHAVA